MKLNPDCIRDILLVVESSTTGSQSFDYESHKKDSKLTNYSDDEIYYHFRQADLNGYLFDASYDMSGSFTAVDLSPKGHNFLSDIRSDNNWNKTKDIASKVGSFSLDALKDISAQVISNLINQQFMD